MLITRRIEIGIERIPEDVYEKTWNLIYLLDRTVYKAANDVISNLYYNLVHKERIRLGMDGWNIDKKINEIEEKLLGETDEAKRKILREKRKILYDDRKKRDLEIDEKCKDDFGTTNPTYRVLSDKYPNIPADILSNINNNVQKTYNKATKELLMGERSLPTHKKGMPIPFSLKNESFYASGRNILVHWFDKAIFHIRFGRDRSDNRTILSKVITNEYKVSNSSIQLKNGKLYLLLVIDVPIIKTALLPSVVVGIDLGINIPLYAALNSGNNRESVGSRTEFLNTRLALRAKRRELQKSLTSTNGGRGRVKKLQALENAKNKERNWVHTKNHTYSKQIIDFAIKNQAGVIHMENLAGIAVGKEFLMSNWSYYELQNLIAYKAKLRGIDVRLVDAHYTSKKCSWCGHIDDGNRQNQEHFCCLNPDCSHKNDKGVNIPELADYNAARNIANSNKIVSSLT